MIDMKAIGIEFCEEFGIERRADRAKLGADGAVKLTGRIIKRHLLDVCKAPAEASKLPTLTEEECHAIAVSLCGLYQTRKVLVNTSGIEQWLKHKPEEQPLSGNADLDKYL